MQVDYPRILPKPGVMEIDVERSPTPSTNSLPASVLEAPVRNSGSSSPDDVEHAIRLPEANAHEVLIFTVPVSMLLVYVPMLPVPVRVPMPVPYEFR
jgi:hypothetical protein